MPKPVEEPEWSSDLSNMDSPSSGQKSTGWTPNQMGVSDYDNWFKYWTWQWLLWLASKVEDQVLYIPGSAFAAKSWTLDGSGDDALDNLEYENGFSDSSDHYVKNTGNIFGQILYAPIPLPTGTTLTGITIYYTVAGGNAIYPNSGRTLLSTGESEWFSEGASDNTGAGVQTQDLLQIGNHGMEDGYAYYITVQLGYTCIIHGVKIEYTGA